MKKITVRKTKLKSLPIRKKMKRPITLKAKSYKKSRTSVIKLKSVRSIKHNKQLQSFSVYEVVYRGEHTPKPLHIKTTSIRKAGTIVLSKKFARGKQVVIIPGTPSQTRLKYNHFRLISISGRPLGAFRENIEPTHDTVLQMIKYGSKIGVIFVTPNGKLVFPNDFLKRGEKKRM